MKKLPYLIGIDEAGRGPLAGPVSVGVVLMGAEFNWAELLGVKDSKKLSAEKRALIFANTRKLKRQGKLDYQVVLTSAKMIDKIGINRAIKRALTRALTVILRRHPSVVFDQVTVKLDGGLKAPTEFKNQETIIKGDDKEQIIGLASITAKVTRDNYMTKLAKNPLFKGYNFEIHKGYGTKAHRGAIKNHGLSPEHRASFCRPR